LRDSLTDPLLDVASSGHHLLERDGVSALDEVRFVLLGSMNIEEGSLRPQFMDRFALSLDVQMPLAAKDRVLIIESRLRFDSAQYEFRAAIEDEQDRLRILLEISQAVTDAGVRSLRAGLAALRASMAHAALARRSIVTKEDIDAVLPLALNHRRKQNAPRPPAPSDGGKSHSEEQAEGHSETKDRIFRWIGEKHRSFV